MTEIENKLWRKTRRYAKILCVIPFLRMVSVCNNLAFGTVDEKSDIDFFIIAKSGRLFIVRSFVTFVLHVLGVRRHGKKIAGRFCLSFFVDDEGMDFSKIAIENDIYLAYWLKSMVPLIDDGVSVDLLKKNQWASRYFEREDDFVIGRDGRVPCKFFEIILKGKFGDFLENRLKKWQMKRANEKARKVGDGSNIVVCAHVLKFHNTDRRREYRRLWEKRYGRALITDERFSRLSL